MTKIINRILILIILVYLNNLTLGKRFLDDFHLPCKYHDTVDLTNSTKFENGSYLYDGIIIPRNLVGTFNYHINYTNDRIETDKHERGCICKIRTCIKWCCSTHNSIILNHNCIKTNLSLNTIISFQSNNLENITEDINKHFYPMIDKKPCETIYPLQPNHPDYYLDDEWILFQNGSVINDNDVFTKDDYCMAANPVYNDTEYEITPHLCFQDREFTARDALYNSTMLLSVPFMIITIIIYMLIPELRNLHGKSLSCYLLGLVFGYSIFGSFNIFQTQFHANQACIILGYICYFSFMSAFFWLSVISFDLWWNFRGIQGRNRFNDKKRFLCYSLYAFGLPTIFLLATITAQNMDIPKHYKPEIGNGRCWFEVEHNWSAAIYFFGPLLILILFNCAMFVLTSWKIHRVQRELSKIIAKEDSRMNFSSERDQFGHFLRLFIIMGVTWILEIISYVLGPNSFDPFFYVTDICNAMQGFIIFALFVLKSKVKRLIIKRFKGTAFINRSSQYSSKTNSSHLNLTAISGPPTSTPLIEAPKFF